MFCLKTSDGQCLNLQVVVEAMHMLGVVRKQTMDRYTTRAIHGSST